LTQIGSSINAGVQGLALQPDGRIVAAGWAIDGIRSYPGGSISHIQRFAAARYRADTALAPQAGPPPLATIASVSRLKLSPTVFRAAPEGPSALATRRGGQRFGTHVRFTLNVSAKVQFKVKRLVRRRRRQSKRDEGLRNKNTCIHAKTLHAGFTRAGRPIREAARTAARTEANPASRTDIATASSSHSTWRARSYTRSQPHLRIAPGEQARHRSAVCGGPAQAK
jgi:hypothetical protein